jgi:ubiquinone/menaquinone biosynthesis C-methylase UbiE
MSQKVDLYNSAYGHYAEDLYREIRVETYGEDLGQTSWVTTDESVEIIRLLRLTSSSHVLEIGSGSGRYALQVAAMSGCRITAVDVNEAGIATANELAAERKLADRVQFAKCDASLPLPYREATYHGIFSNDVLCHIPGRECVLRELFRVLKPPGTLIFSDALIVGGIVSHQEIAARSSIGHYLFSPPGENERLLQNAGFAVLEARDTTENATLIAGRWHRAREKRAEALSAIEGKENFEGLQKFLQTVETLTKERRLQRRFYVAEKKVTQA